MLDERLVRSLHVEALRRRDVHAEHEPHVLFQASTIGALLQGAYEGDLTYSELAEQGDLGLGTFNALDGEMIALDGRFFRADVDGHISEVPPETRTPFAVVVPFAPSIEVDLEGPLGQADLLELLDERLPAGTPACALRIDGVFDHVKARSVPRQRPPYRPLDEVAAAEQHVFELHDTEGSIVGVRFPDYAEGIEVSGYHLHYITRGRARGGHVLDCRIRQGRARLDPSTELHVELPSGVELPSDELSDEARRRLGGVEHGG